MGSDDRPQQLTMTWRTCVSMLVELKLDVEIVTYDKILSSSAEEQTPSVG